MSVFRHRRLIAPLFAVSILTLANSAWSAINFSVDGEPASDSITVQLENGDVTVPITANVTDCSGNRGNRYWRERWFIEGGEEQIEGDWAASTACERQPFTFTPSFDETGTYTITFQSEYRREAGFFPGFPTTDQQASIDIIVEEGVEISGRVDELGFGRQGVSISVDGQDDVETDEAGEYRAFVDPDSTVTLTPEHDDLIFCPQQREVSVGEADRPGIGFQAFPVPNGPDAAGSGGDSVYVDGDDIVHVFCSTGDGQFVPPENTEEVEVLTVAGGGGGGAPLHFSSAGGGGGGAGGVVQRDAYAVDGEVDVTVGAGGAPGDTPNTPSKGEDGDDSVFGDLTALGGGGGSGDNESGNDGGSGGGSRGEPGSEALQPNSASGGEGHRGGVHIDTGRDPQIDRAATGGGGAAEPGEDLDGEPGEDGGFGGDGLEFSTVGEAVTYAGGGGGGAASNGNNEPGDPGSGGDGGGGRGGRSSMPSVPGFPATGAGGGGGNDSVLGAEGGSGIVVVRYPRPVPDPVMELRMEELSWDGDPDEVLDSSDFGNDGSIVGEPNTEFADPAIDGDPGTCRYGVLDGTNDYIEVPDDGSLEASNTDEVTVTAWVNQQADQTGSEWTALVQKSDASYNLQLENGNIPSFTIHDGTHHVTNSTDVVLQNDRWYHLAGTYDGNTVRLYVDGQLVATETVSGTITNASGSDVGIGENLDIPGRHFNGFMDEVRIYTQGLNADQINSIRDTTRPCDSGVDHIRIEHEGSGVSCSPQEIDLRACANNDCSTLVDDPVDVNLTSPDGNWSEESITIPAQDEVTVDLQVPNPGDVTLDAEAVNPSAENPARCFVGSDETCVMSWAEAGFLIDVPDHVAATAQSTDIEAVRTDDETLACTPAFEGEKTVEFSSQYIDPDSGTRPLEVAGNSVPTDGSETTIDLDFDADGVAQTDVVYPDVGSVRLDVRFEGQDDLEQDVVLTGQAPFVTRPDTFDLDIPDLSGAVDADGPVFATAGESFDITVNARNADGDLTPNFGREDDPEATELEKTLVAPSGGDDPALAGDFQPFGDNCSGVDVDDGQACGEFSWPEVGIIGLTPRLESGSYLGTEDVIGDSVDDVGRFIPDRFDVAVSDPGGLEPYCSASGAEFAYSGRAMRWQDRPLFTVTALNADDAVTENYTIDDFRKLDGEDIDRDAPVSDSSALDRNGDPYPVETVQDPLELDDADSGVMTYQYADSDELTYQKSTDSRVDPFTPDLEFSVEDLVDADGVVSPDLPINFVPESDFDLRYGRLRLDNAFGPETLDLIVPMRAEYWESGRFKLNTDESCWAYNTSNDVTLDQEGLSGGSTSVVSVSDSLLEGEPVGGSELQLTAPGEGNTGEVGVTFGVPIWLQDDFNGDGSLEDPTANATFGVFRGHDRIIYWREVQ